MSTRGAGYGLDAELAAKSALKYDTGKEGEAARWLAEVTEVGFTESFADSLKNGQMLCILINRIKPGTIKKVETSKMPFKQMENISNFLKACRVLGVAEHDLFETVDLFEQKDLGVVVNCIHALGRTVQTTVPEFRGPHLGVKMSGKSASSFRSAAPAPSKAPAYNGMTKLAMGSSATMQRSTFNDTRNVAFGANTVGTGATNIVSQQSMGSSSTMQRSDITTSNSVTFGADSASGKSALPPAVPAKKKWAPAPAPRSSVPPPAPSSSYSSSSSYAPSARGGGYGLDAELAKKMALKYDPKLEAEAQQWVEQVIGSSFPTSFAESLKNGQILCTLINTIKPGTIRSVSTSKMPFKQMENVSNYLKACRTLGVAEHDLFETVDLYEQKDMGVVVTCIHALGRAVQGTYAGPKLGAKVADKNVRKFTPDQLKGDGGMTKLAAGSSKTMERSAFNDTNSVTFGNKVAGTGTSGATMQTAGSSATMQKAQFNDTNSINFGANASGTSVAKASDVTMLGKGSAGTMERSSVSKPGITFGADASTSERDKMARVNFDFAASEPGELSLKEGTIVIVLDDKSDPDGWWTGKDSAGHTGQFPGNYVTVI
mmetsp:Transcript_795/g.1685  ORF Transcript_795/g.1685 Transcript_795/m.1685 type:complete len:601 (-) Transcript_795:60-1862(-)|eukprot:CAMPEP_0197548090 /NCGR_PEP_ID=MMETSP1320-20131121/2281_1 /TAXON_ID=91990 /ORGANISM="Bolidomonas sp., Strain RCC2347" /LENGTH=600 /DNA_ID=CAMNT_0043108025 /DNA_START=70 /DNA_END=1872 /DNA_ORIENTATION=+